MAVGNHSFGKISVHGGCTDANEYGEIMRIQAFGGTDVNRRIAAQAIADQVRMDSSSSQDHRDTDAVFTDIIVGQKQLGLAHTHSSDGFFTDARDGGAQSFLPCRDIIGAVDFGAKRSERGLELAPIMRRQNWAIQHQHVCILALLIQYIGKVGKACLQAHHMPFAQAVDRRVSDLAEILAEELADEAGLIADDRQRRIIAHRPNGFFAIFNHGREDHFDIFQRHASGDLTLRQFRARPSGRAVVASFGQVGDPAEAADQSAIILFG